MSAGDRGRWRGGVPAWLSPDACPVQTSKQRAYRAEGIVRLERDSMAKIIKGSGNKEDNNNNNKLEQQCESKREVDKICLQHLLSFGFPLCLARFCISVKCFLRNCHHDPGTHTHTHRHTYVKVLDVELFCILCGVGGIGQIFVPFFVGLLSKATK